MCAVNIDLISSMNWNIDGVYRLPFSNLIEFCKFISDTILTKFRSSDSKVFGDDSNISLADEHAFYILSDNT